MRGLDASTALDYVKSLRITMDVLGETTFITLWVLSTFIPSKLMKEMAGTRWEREFAIFLTRC